MMITLISTRHKNLGLCNSDELYKLLVKINPDVIFEEMPPSFFNRYYVERSLSSLESVAIDKFTDHYKVEHIPVDSDQIPTDSFFKDFEFLIKKIERLTSQTGFDYRTLSNNNRGNIINQGLEYLNSDTFLWFDKELKKNLADGLQELKNEKLNRIYKTWCEVIDNRENHILKNIYSYFEKHPFQNAVFTIGASHRGSIMNKVSMIIENGNINLNWNFSLEGHF